LEGGRSVNFTYPLSASKQSGSWTHYLEASDDLVNWTSLGEISENSDFRDAGALGSDKRFYRIRSQAVDGSAAPAATSESASN
jgi:hypothetical protein